MTHRVQQGDLAALIETRGAMVSPEFQVGELLVQPCYRAPWDRFAEDPMLDRLQGDFVCVPFGMSPASLAGYPAGWSELDPGSSAPCHGYAAGAEWSFADLGDGAAELRIELPEAEPVKSIKRTVRCEAPWVTIEDEIEVRRKVSLPVGLHPMFRLPTEPGAAKLTLPACGEILTSPVPNDPTSVLAANRSFDDPSRAPLRDGGELDLTSLPLPMDTEELVVLADVANARIALDNLAEGYRVILEWDTEYLSHCLLWISNRGRSHEPWNGRNLCLGVEPITSAFDLGTEIAASNNPLAARGLRTAIEFVPERTYVIRHRFTAEALG